MTHAATIQLAIRGGAGDGGAPARAAVRTPLSTAADAGDYRDPSRFAALVSRYQSRVHRLVAGILGPAHAADAEDATQEVFLLAYRKLDSFRGEARVSTWLYRLAYNRAIDYRRTLDRRREDPEPPGGLAAASPASPRAAASQSAGRAPLGRLLADERGRRLRARLESLAPNQRTAVYLHYWLGCTVGEIAELMDSKPATIKSHLFRARRVLARALGPSSEPGRNR